MKKIFLLCAIILLCAGMFFACGKNRESADPIMPSEPTESEPLPMPCQHVIVTDPAVPPSCTEPGKTEGSHCFVCGEILVLQTVVEKLSHTEVVDVAVPATCTTEGKTEGKHCAVCGKILLSQTVLDKTEHFEITEDAVASSCVKWGAAGKVTCKDCGMLLREQSFVAPLGHSYTQGKCSVCQKIQVDYSDIDMYASTEGYTYFSTAPGGKAMQNLYDEMKENLTDFHTNSDRNARYYTYNSELGELYTVAKFDFGKYGLSLEQAQTVYTVFRKDHPVFYWMSYWLYWEYDSIVITTVSEYVDGKDRMTYNERLYTKIAEYADLAEGQTSAYHTALIYYEAILNNNEYAYNEWREAEAAQWAHSILGDVLYGRFICEGYGKLFQLLLNMSGIENMYITGIANTDHVWNLMRMDDGNWYWFDLTWGDGSYDPYVYFCVTDSAMTTHTPTPSNQYGMYFNITLPQRAASSFAEEAVLELGEEFTVQNGVYMLVSSGKVQFVSGEQPISDKLVYNGIVYQII